MALVNWPHESAQDSLPAHERRTAIKTDLFAADRHREKIDDLGDPLQRIERHIDFVALAHCVDEVVPRPVSLQGGRPPYPTETMVRILVLKRLYNLSDLMNRWLTLTAESGDTDAMLQLIEEYDHGDLQRCWTWAYLSRLVGTDLAQDAHYAISEDGSDYDDAVGGPTYVAGRDGVDLICLLRRKAPLPGSLRLNRSNRTHGKSVGFAPGTLYPFW